jgi:curli biogenesis system outer membrane secretion channel CsgG
MLKSRALGLLLGFAAILLQGSLALAQDLPIVGISTIKETVNDSRRYAKGTNFQAMLETQMAKVGRFKLIERSRVDEILAEQGLNNEVGDGQTAGGGFNVAGVDYLVYGSITKLGQTKGGVATGQFATANLITEMSVDIRVVDASTGEIRRAETADARVKSAGAMQTKGFASVNADADPLADVQRLAAKQVAALSNRGR